MRRSLFYFEVIILFFWFFSEFQSQMSTTSSCDTEILLNEVSGVIEQSTAVNGMSNDSEDTIILNDNVVTSTPDSAKSKRKKPSEYPSDVDECLQNVKCNGNLYLVVVVVNCFVARAAEKVHKANTTGDTLNMHT